MFDALFLLVSYLTFSSALKMEAVSSFETSVDFSTMSQKVEFFVLCENGKSNDVKYQEHPG
jgi:hypothetical protein